MDATYLKRTITRLTSRLKNPPPLRVVKSVSELQFPAPADARGVFWDGKVWMVADNIKNLYMSDGSLLTLLDFERVLDELDLYAFKNWQLGELVAGPEVSKYKIACIFMWPEKLMPDPRGARRLLPFDCTIKYKKTTIKIPIKIEEPDDFVPGTHKARLVEKKVWLVEIVIPKALMNDIRTGSIEMEDQSIDLEDLDSAYQEDLDQEEFKKDETNAQPAAQPAIQPAV
jgi:hypothetical protein